MPSIIKIIEFLFDKYHKIFKLYTKSVYTLFIVSNVKREWGYNKDGEFISNSDYRKLKNENKLL